jgi:hypothetical protein
MATLYTSTGAEIGPGINVSLDDIDAKLRVRGHSTKDFVRTVGDKAPQLTPVTQWREYLLLQVFDSEPKTSLFPESGFYYLRGLTVRDSGFLLESEDDPP